jgi:hypothetical protein
MIAWLLWLLQGRPRIRVEMSPEWMEAAGFPCPEVGHFDVPTYKYKKVMRTLQERALWEVERRALGSEEEQQTRRAEWNLVQEKIRAEFEQQRAKKEL